MAAVLEKVQRLEMQILAFVCENLHESASLSEWHGRNDDRSHRLEQTLISNNIEFGGILVKVELW